MPPTSDLVLMSLWDIPSILTLEVEADLQEWALYSEVTIPTNLSTNFTQLAVVEL